MPRPRRPRADRQTPLAVSYLRRAGRGRLADGRLVLWSVAEGSRGRRWRWTVTSGEGTLDHVGLIELDTSGRFVRLELEAAAGMLTFHPADDGLTAHGNVVRADRVDPTTSPWTADAGIRIARDPFASALLETGGRVVVFAADLTLSPGDPMAERGGPDMDERGIPQLIDAAEWPLEV